MKPTSVGNGEAALEALLWRHEWLAIRTNLTRLSDARYRWLALSAKIRAHA